MINNFVGGYTKAILDICDMFTRMSYDRIRITKKSVLSFMHVLIYNNTARELLRDRGSDGVAYVVNPKGEIIDIRRN